MSSVKHTSRDLKKRSVTDPTESSLQKIRKTHHPSTPSAGLLSPEAKAHKSSSSTKKTTTKDRKGTVASDKENVRNASTSKTPKSKSTKKPLSASAVSKDAVMEISTPIVPALPPPMKQIPPSPSVQIPPSSAGSSQSDDKSLNPEPRKLNLDDVDTESTLGETPEDQEAKEKLRKERTQVINEVIDSESRYVKKLQFATENYIHPINEAVKNAKLGSVTHEDVINIFANWEEITGYNSSLLHDLQSRLNENSPQNEIIGDIFLKYIDFFKSYSVYINNFEKSKSTLLRLKDKVPQFREFLVRAQLMDPEHRHLDDYLISIVQRIPRYVLLLEAIVKRTSPNHPDFNNITAAFRRIVEITKLINESKRGYESSSKVEETQKNLYGKKLPAESLIQPSRTFVREDVFQVRGESKSMWTFILFNDLLLVCKRTGPNALKYKFQDSLYNIKAKSYIPKNEKELEKAMFVLKVQGWKDKELVVECKSIEERDGWVSTVSSLKKEAKKKRKSFKLSSPLSEISVSSRLSSSSEYKSLRRRRSLSVGSSPSSEENTPQSTPSKSLRELFGRKLFSETPRKSQAGLNLTSNMMPNSPLSTCASYNQPTSIQPTNSEFTCAATQTIDVMSTNSLMSTIGTCSAATSLSDCRRLLDEIRERLEVEKKHLVGLNETAKIADEEIAKLNEDISRENCDVKIMEDELELMKKEVLQSQEAVETLMQTKDDLEKGVINRQVEKSRLEEEKQRLISRKKHLSLQWDELRQIRRQLDEKAKALGAEISEIVKKTRENQPTEALFAELSDEVSKMEAELEEEAAENKKVEELIEWYEGGIESKQKRGSRRISMAQKELESLRSQLEGRVSRLSTSSVEP